jgi:hypothetical protein
MPVLFIRFAELTYNTCEMYKIKKILSDLGMSDTDDSLEQSFVTELSEFNVEISLNQKTPEELAEMDNQLVAKFYELHDVDDVPEPTPQPTPEPTPEPTPAPISQDEAKAKIIELLNKKRHWDYADLKAIGVDVEKIGNEISIYGYILKKRHFLLEYTVIFRPQN